MTTNALTPATVPTPPPCAGCASQAPEGFVDAVMDRLGLHAADRLVTVPSPAGDLFVAFNDDGISAVMPAALFDGDPAEFAAAPPGRDGAPARRAADRPPAGLRGRAAQRPGHEPALRPVGPDPVRAGRAHQDPRDPLGRGAPLRMGGPRDRPAQGRAGRGLGPGSQSRAGAHPVSPRRAQRRADRELRPGRPHEAGPAQRRGCRHRAPGAPGRRRGALRGQRHHPRLLRPSCVHARRIRPAHEVQFRTSAAARRRPGTGPVRTARRRRSATRHKGRVIAKAPRSDRASGPAHTCSSQRPVALRRVTARPITEAAAATARGWPRRGPVEELVPEDRPPPRQRPAPRGGG